MVMKKVTLIGTSDESFDDAALDALDRARDTIENIKWVEIDELGIEVASTEEPHFQAEVEVAFGVEE
ncbi:MAG: dodecin [Halobacteria archaeon]